MSHAPISLGMENLYLSDETRGAKTTPPDFGCCFQPVLV